MLTSIKGKQKFFWLRWRFDFANNRPPKYGQWTKPAKHKDDMAAFVNRDGLVRACIEAMDIETQVVSTLAECDGHDYVNFQWMAERRQTMIAPHQMMSPVHRLVGLKLVRRDMCVEVYDNGLVKIIARSEQDKNFHYEGFGK